MRRKRLLAICLSFVSICLFTLGYFGLANANSESDFVFEVYDELSENFYAPESLSPAKLLNAGLDGIAEVMAKNGIKFMPYKVNDAATFDEAKDNFINQFENASRFLDSSGKRSEEHELSFAAATALLNAVGDSHSYFITPERYDELKKQRSGEVSYCGIGCALKKLEDGFYYIDAVFHGCPAEKAGIERFDRLVAINGAEIEDFEYIFKVLRGKKGTIVELTLERMGKNIVVKVVLDSIVAPSSRYEIKNDVLYIRLYNFYQQASSELNRCILDAKLKQVKGIILDLRGNGGGQLRACQEIAGFFLGPRIPILIANYRNMSLVYLTKGPLLTNLSMIVLIDKDSASAAEIAAAAFFEYNRAVIVGEKSCGAVSLGMEVELSFGAAMMVPIAELLTANGYQMENNGVVPDIQVVLTKEDILARRDAQLQKAIEELKKIIGE